MFQQVHLVPYHCNHCNWHTVFLWQWRSSDQRIEVSTTSVVESVTKVHMCDNFNPKTFLASVSRLSQAGHRVVFDDPVIGSYTENKNTGVKKWPRQAGGVYFWIWVKLSRSSTSSMNRRSGTKMWHIAHRDLARPQPTQGEVYVSEVSEALNVKTVEQPEQDVDDHQNQPMDIELEIEARDGVIPRGFLGKAFGKNMHNTKREKVLHKIKKTVKLNDDAEERWRYGIWLGVFETSGEHIMVLEMEW